MSTLQSVAIEGGITGHEGVTTPLRNTSPKHEKTKPIRHVSFPDWPTTEISARNNESAHHDGNKHTGSKAFVCQMMFVWMIICLPANIFSGIIFFKDRVVTKEVNIPNINTTFPPNNCTVAYPQDTSLEDKRHQMEVISSNQCFPSLIHLLNC